MVTDFSSKDEIHAAPGDARNWRSSLLLSPGSRPSCGCIAANRDTRTGSNT